jgi:hypothetical protein
MEFDVAQAIAVLERTPRALHGLLDGLPADWTMAPAEDDGWSAFDVVGHLIDGEETDWVPRARLILAQGAERRFVPFDRLRHRTRNAGRPLAALLDEFARLRAANLAELRGMRLEPRHLALTGEHPDLGPVTLAQLLATWVAHDLTHLAQIGRTMARRYRAAVGPWRTFLPALDA